MGGRSDKGSFHVFHTRAVFRSDSALFQRSVEEQKSQGSFQIYFTAREREILSCASGFMGSSRAAMSHKSESLFVLISLESACYAGARFSHRHCAVQLCETGIAVVMVTRS